MEDPMLIFVNGLPVEQPDTAADRLFAVHSSDEPQSASAASEPSSQTVHEPTSSDSADFFFASQLIAKSDFIFYSRQISRTGLLVDE